MKALFKTLCVLAIVLVGQARVQAQLAISIALDRSSYVTDERIDAVVTIENRAGKPVALGGPGGTSWLQFDLKRSDGQVIHAFNGEPKAETTMLKQGATLTRKINLTNFYPVNEAGSYLVSCSAYFPDLQRWIGSAGKSLFTVNSPKSAFWERTVGVPKTHPQFGRYRRYKLFTNKSSAFTPTGNLELQFLYVRITDEETGDNVSTFPIGPILTYRDPQPTTDRDGNLCVLYMAGPQLFQYVVLDVDGAIKDQQAYKPTTTSPGLMTTRDGSVSVRGGRLVDTIGEANQQREENLKVKSLADRPSR
jgi:hypothetical protein